MTVKTDQAASTLYNAMNLAFAAHVTQDTTLNQKELWVVV